MPDPSYSIPPSIPWFRHPQGNDFPKSLRTEAGTPRIYNMSLGDSDIHQVQARVFPESQMPRVQISADSDHSVFVAFIATNSKFEFGEEDDDGPIGQLIQEYRTNNSAPFAVPPSRAQESSSRWEKVTAVRITAEKQPITVGFHDPEVKRDPDVDHAWAALKSIQAGQTITLFKEQTPDTSDTVKELWSWMNALSDLVRAHGNFWYSLSQPAADEARAPPEWLFEGDDLKLSPIKPPMTGAFLNDEERVSRLVDASYLEKWEQRKILSRVFDLREVHRVRVELVDPKTHLMHVSIDDLPGNFPQVAESTEVKFLLHSKSMPRDQECESHHLSGRILDRHPMDDVTIEYLGDMPSGAYSKISMELVPSAVAIDRQIEALQMASRRVVFGDTDEGKGRGISVRKTLLAHRIEMDKTSDSYFQLHIRGLSPITSKREQKRRFMIVRNMCEMKLDEAQNSAMHYSVECMRGGLSLIIGPPGCGKTQTAVYIILLALVLEIPVLATAASNQAVDTLLGALLTVMNSNPELNELCGYCVRLRTSTIEMAALRQDRGEQRSAHSAIEDLEVSNLTVMYAEENRSTEPYCEEFLELRDRDILGGLDGEGLARYEAAYKSVLAAVLCGARLVATTLSNSGTAREAGFAATLMVCDEAGQAFEGDTMIGMLSSSIRAVVLLGDPDQLHPAVSSLHGTNEGVKYLRRSLLGRLWKANYPAVKLSTNYRNHPDILDFINCSVYGGKMKAHPDSTAPSDPSLARAGRVFDAFMKYPKSRKSSWAFNGPNSRRIWLDVRGTATRAVGGNSWENRPQVEAVTMLLSAMFEFETEEGESITGDDIMVLSPYRAQQKLCERALANINIGVGKNLTIDAAQGQEAAIAILMLTKPSLLGAKELEFVADRTRLNVALSRARQALIIVGDQSAFLPDVRDALRGRYPSLLIELLEDVESKGHIVQYRRLELPHVAEGYQTSTERILTWLGDCQTEKDE